ncbi:calcium ATPase, partial [Aureobasidium melanogenum]
MAAKNAVVRSLPSVETLGSCSVICSDKTGTLTTNQMSVNKVVFINQQGSGLEELTVEGTSFAPEGAITTSNGETLENAAASSSTIAQIAEVAALCNDARLSYDSEKDVYNNVGEATEGALRVLAEKIGTRDASVNSARSTLAPEERIHHASKHWETSTPRLATFEFARDRKSMSVLVQDGSSQRLLVKGAPESIIARCRYVLVGTKGTRMALTDNISALLSKEVVDYGNRGLRIMALASVDNITSPLLKQAKTSSEYAQLEQNMTLIGLVGMLDPPRPEVADSIRKCREAGIRVVV